MDIAITRMSSKGQVIIPAEMRKGIQEGDKLLIIKSDDKFILKKADKTEKNFEEDRIFAKRTTEALKRYENGEFEEMEFDEFIKQAKKW